MLIKHILYVSLICLVAGCTQSPLKPKPFDPNYWQHHQTTIYQIKQWSLTARVAIRANQSNWSGGVHWQQNETEYQVRFIGPLGQGRYLLTGNGKSVTLSMGDKHEQANTMNELIHRHIGWDLDLDSLGYWLRGVSNPNKAISAYSLNNQNYLATIDQSGFTVSIPSYQAVNGLMLPKKLLIKNDQINLRIVIKSWKFG